MGILNFIISDKGKHNFQNKCDSNKNTLFMACNLYSSHLFLKIAKKYVSMNQTT